ncbi:YIP1 family protein [Paenibacillus flagellatus]|nr:YIP1 family protein [Paenibacillus flagellatus]
MKTLHRFRTKMRRAALRLAPLLLALAAAAAVFPAPAAAAPPEGYVIDGNGFAMPTPLGYSVERVLVPAGGAGAFKNPAELVIDAQDRLYVADTDHNRVVQMDKWGNVLRVFGTKEDRLGLAAPKGLFVDDDGHLYVADTNNARIVHLSPEGKPIETFAAPKSDLLDADFPYQPVNVALDKRGNLYVQSGNDYHGLIVMDSTGAFQGYIAPNKLKFDLKDWIVRVFATKDQRDASGKKVPPNHRSVVVDPKEGHLYTVIGNTTTEEIKRFNLLGTNTYPAKTYGEYSQSGAGLRTSANLVDLAVAPNGVLTAVDSRHKKLYQYDQEGNMLLAFGGGGQQNGYFQEPVSVALDSEGLLYVLDRALGQVQVLRPNAFASLVHEASALYHEGRYEEALEPWNEVLAMNANYMLAHRGVGKALLKREKWSEAMVQLKLGEDAANYSKAFGGWRHELLRRQFGWIAAGCALLLAAAYYAAVRLRGYAGRLASSPSAGTPLSQAALLVFYPREAFARIQTAPSLPAALLLFGCVVAVRFVEIYATGFHFAQTRPEFANLVLETAQTIVPIAAGVVALWATTTVLDGESTFKQTIAASAYVLLPYWVGQLLVTLLSNVLTLEEKGLLRGIEWLFLLWAGYVLFVQIMTLNDYTVFRTVGVILVALFTMMVLMAAAVLFYMLLDHVVGFFRELYVELYVRSA